MKTLTISEIARTPGILFQYLNKYGTVQIVRKEKKRNGKVEQSATIKLDKNQKVGK